MDPSPLNAAPLNAGLGNAETASCYGLRALASGAKGHFDQAIADLTEAIRLHPNRAEFYFHRGTICFRTGRPHDAVSDFTEAIRLDPTSAMTYAFRAAVWQNAKDFDQAILDLTEAIRLCPGNDSFFFVHGSARYLKGELNQAIDDYTAAIEIDPDVVDAYVARAVAWRRKGEFEKAFLDLREAHRKDPTNAYPYQELAWLQSTASDARFRDGKKAVKNALRACELNAWGEPNKLCILAAAYAEAGNFDAAVEWQSKAVDLANSEQRARWQPLLSLYQANQPYREEVVKSAE
jgi:tetratricopeptide (TPR) repeat protein